LQDYFCPIPGTANQPNFSGDDTENAPQPIPESKQRLPRFDHAVLGDPSQLGRNGGQSRLGFDQRLPVHAVQNICVRMIVIISPRNGQDVM
jgi:hypothetical protein